MDVQNSNIISLTGIEAFTALTVLRFENNQVSSINLSQNINLTYLKCDYNQLTAIDVSQNILLDFLSIQSNQVSSIDVTQNTLLTRLWCNINQLTSINVSQNLLLSDLTCGNNQFTNIDVSQNLLLSVFYCGGNLITNFDVSMLDSLEYFSCAFNPIMSVDVSHNPLLISLQCHQTQLTELDISANPNMVSLIAQQNNLTCLNANNGNIANFTTFFIQVTPNLLCIEVDDPIWATSNLLDIDPVSSFSTNCNNNCTPCFIPINAVDTIIVCDSLTWIDGITYTSNNNTATFNIVAGAVNGCDSIVTLDLTINSTSAIDTRTACDSLTWIDGVTYNSNNNTATFNVIGGNSNGCDSLVTLDFTIVNPTSSTDTRTACDTLIWIDGNTYTSSNNTATFNIIGGNSNGCDSLVTLDFSISNLNANYTLTDNGNGNYSFTNAATGIYNQSHWAFGDGNTSTTTSPSYTFTTNGTYIVVLTINDSATNGSCTNHYLDTLIVSGLPNTTACVAGYAVYPDTINGGLIIVNSSTGSNLTYLWNFGDASTSTLQNPSHTYSTSGPFYLCLTVDDGNGCTDMYCDSIGENGVLFKGAAGFTINIISPTTTNLDNDISKKSDVKIYPNPTSNQLTIVSKKFDFNEIVIVDIAGRIIKTSKKETSTINVADLPSGIYFINLIANDRTIIKKFVKN